MYQEILWRLSDSLLIITNRQNAGRNVKTSWLLKEAKFGRLPRLETTISSLSSARCAPFWGKISWSYWTVLMAWLELITWRHWQFYMTLLDSFTWCYWTVSPDVTGQFHLALLNCITWCYWTVSPGVTGPYHLTLLDSFTCHYWTYWTVSPCVAETYHLTLQDSNRAVQYATTNSLICDCFLKWSLSTWQISQWHSKISWSTFSK